MFISPSDSPGGWNAWQALSGAVSTDTPPAPALGDFVAAPQTGWLLDTADVEAALADGACGASTGLEYTPGAFATLAELIALSKPLAARKLPYATHMRNEGTELEKAVAEAITVAEGAKRKPASYVGDQPAGADGLAIECGNGQHFLGR